MWASVVFVLVSAKSRHHSNYQSSLKLRLAEGAHRRAEKRAANADKDEQRVKELKLQERAFRSAKRNTYHSIPERWGSGIRCSGGWVSELFAVALASDEDDPLPIFAAVNSTLSNAADPASLSFVVYVTTRARAGLASLVDRYLGNGTVSICVGLEGQLQNRPAMRALAPLGNSSRVKRKELLSSFNFAAFYLPHILKARRILYMDSDVIVRSDVGELARMPMHGKPAAAVEDCSQLISKYIDFNLAGAYRRAAIARVERAHNDGCGTGSSDCEPKPLPVPPNTSCVFNRGVLLLNRDVWLRDRYAEHIERHVVDFVHSRGALFRSGVSQPPFLLALATRYHQLPGEWNVRGLGRDAVGQLEWHDIAAATRRFYPGFVDVEHALLDFMKAVAKVRRGATEDHDDADSTGVIASTARPQLPPPPSWRTQLLDEGRRATRRALPNAHLPAEFGVDLTFKHSILAILEAPPGHHRGAERPQKYKTHYPYVCPFAAHAKILHFNGEVKPWRMSAATVTHVEPSEGAVCLWRDIADTGHFFKNGSLPGRSRVAAGHHARSDRACGPKTVRHCVSSCALDWHRYVAGYVADLRREADILSPPPANDAT